MMDNKDFDFLKGYIDEKFERVQNGARWGDKLLQERLDGMDKRLERIETRLKDISERLDETGYVRRVNFAFITSFVAMVFSLLVFIIKFVLK